MSLWSRLFGGGASPQPVTAPVAPRGAVGPDALANLLSTPQEHRHEPGWFRNLEAAVPDAPLAVPEPDHHTGPDGFPYRNLHLPSGPGGSRTTLRASLDSILDAGQGAVIFWPDGRPAWVFTFGDLLALGLYGNLQGDPADDPGEGGNHAVTLRAGTQMLVASPSESYFPGRARRALGAYLHRRVAAGSSWRPGLAMVTHPDLRPSRNLMLNIGLAELRGDQAALDTEMRFVRWFLPRNHGLLARSPAVEDGAFQPL